MSANPSGFWGVVVLVLGLLGVGKIVGDVVTRQLNLWKERAEYRRKEQESSQESGDYWQGRAMTLQSEMQKRDEKIAALEEGVAELKNEMLEIKSEFADVLRENRRYRDRYGPLGAVKETA